MEVPWFHETVLASLNIRKRAVLHLTSAGSYPNVNVPELYWDPIKHAPFSDLKVVAMSFPAPHTYQQVMAWMSKTCGVVIFRF